jgi:hypothetical protein
VQSAGHCDRLDFIDSITASELIARSWMHTVNNALRSRSGMMIKISLAPLPRRSLRRQDGNGLDDNIPGGRVVPGLNDQTANLLAFRDM